MRCFDDGRNVGGAGGEINPQHRQQHQQRAEQGVEEELEAGINAPLAAPDADDEEHRNQPAFEEDVEQEQVERRENTHHQRFQRQESDHVFRHAGLDRLPACQNAERQQQAGEHHEQHRNAVDAHVIGNAGSGPEPLGQLDKLKCRRRALELAPQINGQRRIDQGDDERHPAGGRGANTFAAAGHQDEQRADQRKEGDDGEKVTHSAHHPNTNMLASPTTPISIAKA